MARKLRLQYPGAIYRLMYRGDHLEPVFLEDADRRLFLRTLSEACAKSGWRSQAWVLMGNHYHLLLERPEATLAASIAKRGGQTRTCRTSRQTTAAAGPGGSGAGGVRIGPLAQDCGGEIGLGGLAARAQHRVAPLGQRAAADGPLHQRQRRAWENETREPAKIPTSQIQARPFGHNPR